MTAAWAVAGTCLVLWIGLLFFRGGFWRVAPRLDTPPGGFAHTDPQAPSQRTCSVATMIPARNEADILPQTLPTVVAQEYEGVFHVTLIDDQSTDATADIAQEAAKAAGRADRLTVLRGDPLPTGWAGKVWALAQGSKRGAPIDSDYLWFTDADIAYDAGVLRALVDKAESEELDLVSVMACLRVDSRWDRLLIPAFVYFFAKLYPFRFVGDPRRRTAGAAGGCVLVRRRALQEAGGLEAIRSALIDDCALGRLIKRHEGRIWLGFTKSVRSVRPYGSLRSIWDMVARSAYDQLQYSPLLVVGTVLGMMLLYAVAPLATLGGLVAAALGLPGAAWLALIGGMAWSLMTASFLPILDHHGAGRWIAIFLPVAGTLYTAMVLSSAWRHRTGRSGAWKGRTRGAGDATSA
ncbi:MAG: glycosyltransferase [Candidatus Bipolaricaulota bacterium]|nr:glycosyltransferase [Candidatus Bipolaricaulota bacterium]